ncbi:TetR/AcrR family transcriptional regulator [Actinomycetospora sp. NBRC 106378]|uniref:TetR/AcrR family transcriptional regulator n=1 Tax=Actinomycetospora sp. NBRC 106378 TaxID=3032208 RepID=UPI0024A16C30|nr:TetR/AcrR family transcriptional regulator [Actinomycetospora sp. NBRC 106378]GLZ52081.1 putative transcriptional regulator, TetR family protein [Actinomycetospora sp. NBRC 106378]
MTRRLPRSERRVEILAAARRLFAERGFDATTTREIAAAAGVSDALIYRHFANKEDLLRGIVDDGIARFSALGGPPPGDVRSRDLLEHVGVAFVAACSEQLDLLVLLVSQQHVLADDTRFVEFVHGAATGLGRVLAPDDPTWGYLLARSFMGSLVAFVLLQQRLGLDRVHSVEAREYVRTLVAATVPGENGP